MSKRHHLISSRLLRRVPAGPFRDMRQIWPALPGVPVEPEAPERVEG